MKIAFFHPSMPEKPRGAEIHLAQTLLFFKSRGHDCVLVTGIFKPQSYPALLAANIPVFETGGRSHPNPWIHKWSTLAGMKKWLRDHAREFDLLNFWNWPSYLSASVLQENFKPCIHMCLEPTQGWILSPYAWYKRPVVWALRSIFKPMEVKAMRRMTKTLVHTPRTAELLKARYGKDATPTYLGVDVNRFRPMENKAQARKIFGFDDDHIHVVSGTKGLKNMLAIFSKAKQKNQKLKLHVIGLKKKPNADTALNPLPAISNDDLPALYNAADLFWLYSPEEPWGLVVVESMACGTPALALNSGGPSFIIEADKNGFLAKDDKHMEDLLSQMDLTTLRDQNPKNSLSSAARSAVQKNFRWEQTCDLYAAIFQDVFDHWKAEQKR